MYGLTKDQKRVYTFIADFISRKGYSPSYNEIGRGLGISSRSNVMRYVNALIERRAIEKLDGQHRSIRLVKDNGTDG